MANEIYDNTWFGNTIDTASSIGTSTEMIQGQINMNKLGDDLVVNGDFATDSDWSKGSGWSIQDGIASHTGGASYLSQSILEPNRQYKVNIKVLQANGSNFVQIYMGNSPASVLIQDVGEYQYIFTSQSIQTLGFALRGVGDVSIDNVSVQQVRAYRPIEELVKNGDFSTDLNGWIISNNDATHNVTWSSEGANFVSDTTSPLMTFGFPVTLLAFKKYKFVIKLKNNGGTGNIKAQTSGLNFQPNILDGTYEEIIIPTQNQSSVSFYRNGSNIDLYIQSFSIKQVDQDQVEAKKCLADAIHRIGLQDIQN